MTTLSTSTQPTRIIYPESDGMPMSENTVQFRWIVTLQGNLDARFADDPNVLVVGDLLWYPVEGNPKIRSAPDVMVILGRHKGDRGSYRQWEEGGIAPQVVFEVRSPGNRFGELKEKFEFFQRYGVEEYYLYDPDNEILEGWQRSEDQLVSIANMDGWVSPRLAIRFDLSSGTLVLYHPDGRPFDTFLLVMAHRAHAEKLAREAQEAVRKAEDAAAEAQKARREADDRAEKLAAKLRSLGIDPDA